MSASTGEHGGARPDPPILWEPSQERKDASGLAGYMRWLQERRGLSFAGYEALWEWSVTDLDAFWGSVWEFFDIRADATPDVGLSRRDMPGAEWFPGVRLNYAEQVFRRFRGDEPAIVHHSEARGGGEITWAQLRDDVAALAAALRELGVQPGDRVAAYLPNTPEAVVAFLACASMGVIWSSTSPDLGVRSVVDRFAQIEPRILFTVDGYRYGGKDFDRLEALTGLVEGLPTVEHTVVLSHLRPDPGPARLEGTISWDELLERGRGAALHFEPLEFDHPLWILYSSGTTGLPKAIVHGHGGIVMEHLKSLHMHLDVTTDDRFFWFTTTGWMMWNLLVGGLLAGAAIVLFDGSPGHPDTGAVWAFVEQAGVTCFGTSAGYLTACMKAGLEPGRDHDLSRLRSVGSTGSPLPPEGFAWVYEHVKEDVWLFSTSGGTDVCTAFVGGCPLLPVRAGELQCRALGVAVAAYDGEGREVVGEVGELVVTEPMPSMPVFFWNDPGGERYRDSYFDMYPGVWRHGDWIRVTERGSCVIYGRSDATINRQGVRMGTSEIYRVVEGVPGVLDSLVVDVPRADGGSEMSLFVVLAANAELDPELLGELRRRIREDCSPRHVPDQIHRIDEVPRTLTGKKLEVPVKKILMGAPVDSVANVDSLAGRDTLLPFVALAGERQGLLG